MSITSVMLFISLDTWYAAFTPIFCRTLQLLFCKAALISFIFPGEKFLPLNVCGLAEQV